MIGCGGVANAVAVNSHVDYVAGSAAAEEEVGSGFRFAEWGYERLTLTLLAGGTFNMRPTNAADVRVRCTGLPKIHIHTNTHTHETFDMFLENTPPPTNDGTQTLSQTRLYYIIVVRSHMHTLISLILNESSDFGTKAFRTMHYHIRIYVYVAMYVHNSYGQVNVYSEGRKPSTLVS